ncbi:MAG TPA: hypothetical protein VMH90_03430 [Thermoplasmata archaeon]|nr:hypothetical protein [Thermoplasmata archaeon]
MKRQSREELERIAQSLERKNGQWSASEIERAIRDVAPVAYGEWTEETPNRRSRLRSVQRWRTGARGRDAGKGAAHLFPYVWPVGDRQRQELDPSWTTSTRNLTGSWRLFLYNCAPEVVRDVRIYLDGEEVDYAPSILVGRFAEVHWQRIEAVRAETLQGDGAPPAEHLLSAEFVIAKGTRHAAIGGRLRLDPGQGWSFFASRDGRRREIE